LYLNICYLENGLRRVTFFIFVFLLSFYVF